MFSDYEYDDNTFPLAYLITFRCYGTWLHGDEKGAVDRHGKNIYGTADISANKNLKELMREKMPQSAFLLDKTQRQKVEEAIAGVCQYKNYNLHAVNARSNHVHFVVAAASKPELLINIFKAYSTRKLREEKLVNSEVRLWSRGGSRRYLWKPRHVALAVEYVLYGQGDIPSELL
ncbi:MAG: transposase [Acidobacteriota bacterium]|nr:transposase [Acidobacteriota bacterium]